MRRRSTLRPRLLRTALASLLGLALAAPWAGPAAAQNDQAQEFFQRFGFQEAGQEALENGGTGTRFAPGGVWASEAELRLDTDAGGEVTVVELLMSRELLSGNPAAAHELVAAYLKTAVPYEDEQEVAGLQGMILSPDEDVRRGETEPTSDCCAYPPIPARDRAAVAVVDGRGDYALVRLFESSLRFESVLALGGRPALRVTVRSTDAPEQVVEAVFDAARHGDASWLADLCLPGTDIDGDAQAVCRLDTGSADWAGFVDAFRTGEITGAAEIDGDEARVPFRFGPEGDRDEVMTLVRIDGRWGLSAF